MDICGKRIELQVRRSNRVRGHRMVVRYGLPPELVVRPRATQAQIDEAIDFHRSWLELQLAKTIEPRLGLDRLRLTEEQGRVEARARITLLAQSEAAALGVSYSRITMRNQRSRWGSCSSSGALSFNWRLVLAPHDVLDYVVVHEVCHLRFLDHSQRFWKLVEGRRPQWREQRDWLREHGPELLAFRASE